MLDPSLMIYLIALTLIAFAGFLARRTRFVFGVMAAVSSITLIFSGWWTWLLRDGMGPDSIESQGIEALTRFLDQFWIPAVLWALLIGIGLFILKATKARSTTPTGALGP